MSNYRYVLVGGFFYADIFGNAYEKNAGHSDYTYEYPRLGKMLPKKGDSNDPFYQPHIECCYFIDWILKEAYSPVLEEDDEE